MSRAPGPAPSPVRRRAIVLAVLAMALAACGTSSATPAGSTSSTALAPGATSTSTTTPSRTPQTLPPVTPLQWSSCDSQFECARLLVPISYADPGAGSLSLSVVELPATGRALGDIVLNPGGPGGSGVDFLEQSYQGFDSTLRADFNLVSFDPRGVNQSDPVRCVSPAGLRLFAGVNPAPIGQSEIEGVVQATKTFVAACEAHTSSALLANLSTAVVARDMDRLRAALGQSKLTYFGFSYGTYLGAIYAQEFPTHVRALVLDGAVDPLLSQVQLDQAQAVGFETDLHDFYAWCATNSECQGELPDPQQTVDNLLGQLQSGGTITASLSSAFGGTQQVDYGVALLGVLQPLYSKNDWPDLGAALAAAANGDASELESFALQYLGFQQNGSVENIMSANVAVNCLDRPSPTNLSVYPALAQEFAQVAPVFGANSAWSTLTCAYWPFAAQGRPGPLDLRGTPPVLVIGTTHDPATPYRWAQDLTKQFPHGVLLTRQGDGHTAYFYSTCVQQLVDTYLVNLRTPPPATVCPSNG